MTGNKTQPSGILTPSNAAKGPQRLMRSRKLLRCRSWMRRILLGKKNAEDVNKTTSAVATTRSPSLPQIPTLEGLDPDFDSLLSNTGLNRSCSSQMRSSLEVLQSTSPLLRLPGELRNKIYGYVFSGIQWPITSWAYTPHADLMTFSALPQTCRQLRAECRLLPYIYAEYELWSSLEFCDSLKLLDEEAQAVVCHELTEVQRHALLQCDEFDIIFERIRRRKLYGPTIRTSTETVSVLDRSGPSQMRRRIAPSYYQEYMYLF